MYLFQVALLVGLPQVRLLVPYLLLGDGTGYPVWYRLLLTPVCLYTRLRRLYMNLIIRRPHGPAVLLPSIPSYVTYRQTSIPPPCTSLHQ
ncbi:hypothetical protein F5Y17DRAFT_140442 [Xylariaceae sp. FL0594]|nr:hypothetical protein F5Y17DRAFT_140442 [Xylariaceae sp. FL0594]